MFLTQLKRLTFASVLAACVSAHSHLRLEDLPPRWQDWDARGAEIDRMDGVMRALRVESPQSSEVQAVRAALDAATAGTPGANKTCRTCMELTPVVLHMLTDKTSITEDILPVLDKVCEDVLPKKADAAACRAIGRLAVSGLGFLISKTTQLGFNLPGILCSDLAHVCSWDCCGGSNEPQQVALAFASRSVAAAEVDMRVTWVTQTTTPGAKVQFKVNNGTWKQIVATERTYVHGGWRGMVHSAVMPALPGGATIAYRVGVDAIESPLHTFKTLPANAGTPGGRPIRFLSLADMGCQSQAAASVKYMKERVDAGAVDFVWHYGDLGYADGYEPTWDMWGRQMSPISSTVPYMTGPGNHELMWNFTAYKTRQWMPEPGHGAPTTEQGAMYYRLDAGPLALLMLDSESPLDTPLVRPAMYLWAQKELAAARREGKMITVAQHRPLYCTTTSSGGDCTVFSIFLRRALEQLYNRNGVALVTVGHLHNYERTYPMVNSSVAHYSGNFTNIVNPAAPVYVVNGAAGNREGQTTTWMPKPSWSVLRSSAFGLADVSVSSRSTGEIDMTTTFVDVVSRKVVDQFTITQNKK